MGWTTDDGAHEGRAVAVAPDGRGSIGFNRGEVLLPGGDRIPEAEVVGWRGQCGCGWTGPHWTRVPDPDRADRTRREVFHPDGPADPELENRIRSEWEAHVASADTTADSARVPRSPTVVNCAVYVDGVRLPGRWSHTDAYAEVRARGAGFVWLGLFEPGTEQLRDVAETFGLHELAVEDALEAHQRPKIERYDDTLFAVLKTVHYVEHESPTTANEIVETGEIMAFLGADFVVTVRHGQRSALHHLRAWLEADPERLALGPAVVLHAIADHIVDDYLAVTRSVETDLDVLESMVFDPATPIGVEPLYLMKREIIEMRRAVLPLAAPMHRLAAVTTPAVPKKVRSHFRDVDDHLSTVTDRIANFDVLLTTLVDATLATVAVQQNSDMRKITAWAAIIAVITSVVGVYGMNFDFMPELHWKYGYPMVLAVIAAVSVYLYRTFSRNKWL
ncbi:MAG: magnesium and cobalt transport protein CorA [Rhodococcus sp. (in: high G+C Gram-positive bacteria)]|nr:MAG: magnesium and cobalt transport protein CorA [Rhodococcus sp. (in: high G+C Gram-positive bacteria)]